jgi:hypothetical protein
MFRGQKIREKVSFTPAEDRIIKKSYLTVPVKRLSVILGRVGETALHRRMRQLDLVIPRKIIEQRKKDSRIKKGHVPMNKGKKMAEYCRPEVIRKIKKTQFKKGIIPKNTLYNGCIVIRKRQNRPGSKAYKWIRIRKGYWEQLHVHIWKKKHGQVPDGKIIVFLDGNTMNVTLKNLKCITRQQHCENTRNSDGWIAMSMAHEKGARGKINKGLQKRLLQNKELIELKRTQLLLQRTIKQKQNGE